ncbi:MAG: ABC transporter permease [Corynebacterium sp.]|nr:ABC transporter permease [Corynebacterium sp.]
MSRDSMHRNTQVDKKIADHDIEHLREESTFPPEREMRKITLYRRRFLRNRGAVVGLVIFAILLIFAIFGGFIAKWDYTDPDFMNLSSKPSPEHWFGTDSAGMDLFAQSVHGLGRSLTIAVIVSFLTMMISAFVGTFAAYRRGMVERLTLLLIHFLLSVPSFLILALMVSSKGGDWRMLIFALTILGWVGTARVIWTMSTSVREREYVQAARFMGVSDLGIVFRHIIPNVSTMLVLNFTYGVQGTVMSETGLSFLGLGVQLPDCSLGTLLGDGVASLHSSPWLFIFPAVILTLLTISMALIADGMRDALDPNSAAGGKAK